MAVPTLYRRVYEEPRRIGSWGFSEMFSKLLLQQNSQIQASALIDS